MGPENLSANKVSLVSSAEMYIFRNLLPSTEYHISIWAVNKAGRGQESTLIESTDARLLSTLQVAGMLDENIMCIHLECIYMYSDSRSDTISFEKVSRLVSLWEYPNQYTLSTFSINSCTLKINGG